MAPSTRATSRVEKSTSPTPRRASQARSGTLQKRLLDDLHIEGTGLVWKFPKKRPAKRHQGVWYEDEEVETESPEEVTRQRRTPRRESPEPERMSGRSRRARRNGVPNASRDETFLGETISQLRASRAARNSIRRRDIERILPYLEAMSAPVSGNGETADLHLLDKTEARRLLGSNEEIQVPVLVPDGAEDIFDTETDARRPLEQVFDHFHNPTETDETVDGSKRFGTGNDLREVRLSDLRDRLLLFPARDASGRAPTYPFNFPDIPNPLPASGVPAFMQTPRTNLLKTLIRNLLPIDPRTVCPEKCPHATHAALKCGRHALSGPELLHLQSGWMHWQGTLMLAEPGALTHAHWDKWGFGTWVACHEGEMAFAWLSRPDEVGRTRWLTDGGGGGGGEDVIEGRWVFVVLRPGDVLYMPSGTVHLVFRRPGGGPTLGLAGHVIRTPDLVAWLRALRWEVEDEIRNPDVSVPYGEVVPCLVAGLKTIIEREDMSEREIEGFGGEENLDEARMLLEEIERMVDDL